MGVENEQQDEQQRMQQNEQQSEQQSEQQGEQPKSQKRQAIIAIVVLAVIVVAAFAGYRLVAVNAATSAAYELLSAGDSNLPSAADVASCRITTSSNEQTTLGAVLEGKPAVVNFWASWCPHCINEMGDYQRLYDEYGNRVQFVMVDITQGRSQEYFLARDFVKEEGYTMPVYYDFEDDFSTVFSLRGLPTSVMLSASGDPVMVHAGEITYDKMKATIEAVLSA